MKEQITLDEAIAYLDELVTLDTPAMGALIANRVPCNEALADHPAVQASEQHGGFHIGLIDIINGMFGVHDGWGPITFTFDDGEGDTRARNLTGFSRSRKPVT